MAVDGLSDFLVVIYLFLVILLLSFEIIQIKIAGFKKYVFQAKNFIDFVGLNVYFLFFIMYFAKDGNASAMFVIPLFLGLIRGIMTLFNLSKRTRYLISMAI